MSWKPQVLVKGEQEWCSNGLRFATKAEADDSARDLMMRWMLVIGCRAVRSADPVNYSYVGRQLRPVAPEAPTEPAPEATA